MDSWQLALFPFVYTWREAPAIAHADPPTSSPKLAFARLRDHEERYDEQRILPTKTQK